MVAGQGTVAWQGRAQWPGRAGWKCRVSEQWQGRAWCRQGIMAVQGMVWVGHSVRAEHGGRA
jgi:hypothetical protein